MLHLLTRGRARKATPNTETPVVIIRRGAATLLRNPDGTLACHCPFACTHGRGACEFAEVL